MGFSLSLKVKKPFSEWGTLAYAASSFQNARVGKKALVGQGNYPKLFESGPT